MADGSVRDTRVLTWVGEQRGVPLELVPWLLGRWSPVDGHVGPVAVRTARRWVERVEARGLAERVRVLGSPWLMLTQHGARLMGVGWSRYGMPRSRAEHQAAVSVCRMVLECSRDGVWLPESRFGRVFTLERTGHRPDGGWLLPGGTVAGVEVELSRKAMFADAYRDLMERMPVSVDVVWWFCREQDRSWLTGRLAGSSLPVEIAVLPTMDPATHPAACRCPVCRLALEEHTDHVHVSVAGLGVSDE